MCKSQVSVSKEEEICLLIIAFSLVDVSLSQDSQLLLPCSTGHQSYFFQ